MATGIHKRHSRTCRTRHGGRCSCNAGWGAWVYLPRHGTKVRRTFQREAEAKSWRADAVVAASRGALRLAPRDRRTIAEAVHDYIEKMKGGSARPRGRAHYKPRRSARTSKRSLATSSLPTSARRGSATYNARRSAVRR
jgi:hypothetical protein